MRQDAMTIFGYSLSLLGLATRCLAQPCSLDPSFNPAFDSGSAVYGLALQTNGQIVVGGAFSSIEGVAVANVARLNADGSLDRSFNPGPAADFGYVNSVAIQNDGKVVIGGFFFSSTGADLGIITRLNANGSVDEDFNPNLFVDAQINSVVLQPDGKILIGGGFDTVNGIGRRSIARLNSDGTLDATFDACVASGADSGAIALALQSDGRILASGTFTFSNTGGTRAGIARLGLCGEFDSTFAPEPGVDPNGKVWTIVRRKSGEVLFGGNFYLYHSVPRSGLAQLTADGVVDTGFDPGTGINIETSNAIYAIAIQPDGTAVIGGNFNAYDEQPSPRLARINLDGSFDAACDAGLGPDDSISSLLLQPDGRILVAGKFSSFDGEGRTALARLKGGFRPRLDFPTWLENGRFQMTFHGQPAISYAIQASSNLLGWLTITNFTFGTTGLPVVDSEANSFPNRFYRAIVGK